MQRFAHNIATQAHNSSTSTLKHHLYAPFMHTLCAYHQLINDYAQVYAHKLSTTQQGKLYSLIIFYYQGKLYLLRLSIFIYLIYVTIKKSLKVDWHIHMLKLSLFLPIIQNLVYITYVKILFTFIKVESKFYQSWIKQTWRLIHLISRLTYASINNVFFSSLSCIFVKVLCL